MTLENILTLSKAGFTAQQIAAMEQPQMAQPQMMQPQMAQPQMTQPQMAQPQMVQPQMVQAQPQMVQPQMDRAQPQMVQPQTVQNGQYVPVLPQTSAVPQQSDPMKDVMLQNYMNAPSANMYNVHDVVADMIGANAPVDLQQTGGKK